MNAVVRARMRDRLIVGLDVPSVAEAEKVVAELGDVVSFYKIGYQLAFAGGLEFARDLAASGKKVFLDMKLLDIDNTVAKGVENIVKMGMSMLTLHAYPKAMKAAVEAAKGSDLCLLGVTVLTSMDEQDVIDAGYEYDPHTLVLRRAEQARAAVVILILISGAGCPPFDRERMTIREDDAAPQRPPHPASLNRKIRSLPRVGARR